MHSRYKDIVVLKPWGYEYLVWENTNVAVWGLTINKNQSTSMHCHEHKTTGLVVVEGTIELSFLGDKRILTAPAKCMIRRGLFHSSKALSDVAVLLEIETPNNKEDVIRLHDHYGREGAGYETKEYEMVRSMFPIYQPQKIQLGEHIIRNISRMEWKDDNIYMILEGGFGKIIDDRKRYMVLPGDVGKGDIIRQVAKEANFTDSPTKILEVHYACE